MIFIGLMMTLVVYLMYKQIATIVKLHALKHVVLLWLLAFILNLLTMAMFYLGYIAPIFVSLPVAHN